MKHSIRPLVAGVFLALSSGAAAVNDSPAADKTLPELEQESQHAVSAKRVTSLFTRAHYKEIELNDSLSGQMFERYLDMLDGNRNLFFASDIKQAQSLRYKFDEALKSGNLSIAYDLYELNMQRRKERYEYALSLLESPFDFTVADDKFHYDREEADWPKTQAEMDELWRQRVKYDALNLKLAGKEWEGIKEVLTKRYERAIRRLNQTNSEDVFQTAMNAFARSIEAHTSYLSPRNAERFQMEMNLEFEGIGAVLQVEEDFTVIRSVVPGGPADKSGKIKPEDKIVGVAQEGEEFVDVVGWRLDEVVDLIKGPKGSVVRLQVLKGSTESTTPDVVRLTRDKIKLEDRAAKSEVYTPKTGPNADKKLGVITIPSFYNNLHEDVAAELESLNEQDVEAIIVDLRGNGGGSLSEATLLTGLFIEQGPVVQIRDGAGRIREEADRDGKVAYSGPLTVLVDRYSASASEIFAAAMQDYERALIIGEQTFGKGTVQQHRGLGRIYDLYDNKLGSVQFTIAKFYRIDGGSTQHKGVVPDIRFPSPIEPEEWGESQEDNALPWDRIQRASYTTYGDADAAVEQLRQAHQQRIDEDPEFQYIEQDIQRYLDEKDKKYVSLVEAERRADKKEREEQRLTRVNERLKRMGKEPLASLDEDLPEVLDELDPLLDEAAAITFDMINTGHYAINQS
ncbi:C-terminal processing peptidase [Saliniradius amylolyticus]|uniref:C-terminal processing peptidase n=1 Tax=Saliniradius amylolyticus TaxID=2183582 RepID=A0A2S2E4F7_9ALTE|nr:carboxy terminal-processing peptidase [Saliniradius amylolyticus]AWL11887.1 C-terminal processing peptidase [Saliniradius amylolyticus]